MLFPRFGGRVFGKPFRSEVEVHLKANSRCERSPEAAKSSIFYRFWTRRLTLKITPTQVKKRCPCARQAMLFPRFGGRVFGKPFGSEVEVHLKANPRCEMSPKAAKSSIFYRFWTRRLTLKITHSQVKKRCP